LGVRKSTDEAVPRAYTLLITKEQDVKQGVGLSIDHREAFLVLVAPDAEDVRRLESGMKKDVRFSGGNRSQDGSADDRRDRQFTAHLDRYHDEAIATIHDAEAILLPGPGEAKGELKRRLETRGPGGRVVGVETVDKMTAPQIAARVREHFRK
jgi:hypothetical protein